MVPVLVGFQGGWGRHIDGVADGAKKCACAQSKLLPQNTLIWVLAVEFTLQVDEQPRTCYVVKTSAPPNSCMHLPSASGGKCK